MIKFFILFLLVVSTISAEPGIFVEPGMNSVPYDILISNRSLSSPSNSNEVHLRAAYYVLGMKDEYYDSEGEVLERWSGDGSFTSMWFPISADINLESIGRFGIITDFRYWISKFGSESTSDFVLSDICLFSEKVFSTQTGWYFGPRFAFIYSVDELLPTNYNDIDISMIIGKSTKTKGVVIDSKIGGRYSFKNVNDLYNFQPGPTVYMNVRPGYSITSNFALYGTLDFALMLKSKSDDGSEIVDSEAYAVYSGFASTLELPGNNSIGCILEFPLSGKNADKELLIGFNYDTTIPF